MWGGDWDCSPSFASLSLSDRYQPSTRHNDSFAGSSSGAYEIPSQRRSGSRTAQSSHPSAQSLSTHGRAASSRNTNSTLVARPMPHNKSAKDLRPPIIITHYNLRPRRTLIDTEDEVLQEQPTEDTMEQARQKQEDLTATHSHDENLPETLEQQSTTLRSPSITLERTSFEGYEISRKSTKGNTSRKPGCQIIEGLDDEKLTKPETVEKELHHRDTGIVGDSSSDLALRIESPQAQEHPSYGCWSHTTESSTPESSSSCSAEYSEDDEAVLDPGHPLIGYKPLGIARVLEAYRSFRCMSFIESYISDPPDRGDIAIPFYGFSTDDCYTPDCPDGEDVAEGSATSEPADRFQGGPTCKDKGKGKKTATRKRAWEDLLETSEEITYRSVASPHQKGPSKRRATTDRSLTFACPYAKKDPMSHKGCYKYTLSRIRDVKQHLARCHRNPLYCPRCMDTFEKEEERDDHIRKFSCPSRPDVKLDGITESQRLQLAKKSPSNISLEDQWFAVFDILFPGYDPRPGSPYIDSELVQDITLYQDFLKSNGPRILSEVLTERGAVTWKLPNKERDLAAFQDAVFQEGLRAIFDQWITRSSDNRENLNVSSSSGSAGQDCPSPCLPPILSGVVGSTSLDDPGDTNSDIATGVPNGARADVLFDIDAIPGASSNWLSFGEGFDGPFDFQHVDFRSDDVSVEFLPELTCDGLDDELMRSVPPFQLEPGVG